MNPYPTYDTEKKIFTSSEKMNEISHSHDRKKTTTAKSQTFHYC